MVTMTRLKKVVLMTTISIGIVLSIVGIIYILNNPKTYTEEIMIFDYTLQPNLSYEVNLIDNILYDTVQQEGAIYIKNILNYININFGVNYQASEIIPIQLEYAVNASVVGFNSSNNIKTNYWRKEFPIIDNEKLHIESNILQEEINHQLKLDTYENFAMEANRLTGVNLSTELVVSMIGSITATSPDGEKVTPFNINMTIPLQENLIEITKGSLDTISERFTDSTVHTLPIEIKYIVLLSVLIVLLVAGLLFSIFRIYEPTQKVILRNEVKKIVSNHGSRMVALQSSPSNKEYNGNYEVASIKDLIILSDDINKPIYYVKDDSEFVKDSAFYVEDKGVLYVYTHRTAYNKKLYFTEQIKMSDLAELQKNEEDESPTYPIADN